MYDYSYKREYYKNKRIAKAYDAKRFYSLKGRIGDWLDKLSLLRTLVLIPRRSSVLDVACGTGRITKFLAHRGFKVWGSDVSEEMLQVARMRLINLYCFQSVYQADAEKLPFANERFDAVVSVRFFGHVPSYKRISILCEIKRVSKRYVIIQCPIYHRGIPTIINERILKNPVSHLPTFEEVRTEFQAVDLEIQAMFPKLLYFLNSWTILAKKAQ